VTWVALAVAVLALVVALSARMKAGAQGGQVEEAARDARRRIDALGEFTAIKTQHFQTDTIPCHNCYPKFSPRCHKLIKFTPYNYCLRRGELFKTKQ
jgi:hypothetical protein